MDRYANEMQYFDHIYLACLHIQMWKEKKNKVIRSIRLLCQEDY